MGRAGAELPAGARQAQPVVIDWERIRRHAAADVPDRGVNVKRHADTLLRTAPTRVPVQVDPEPEPADGEPAGTPRE